MLLSMRFSNLFKNCLLSVYYSTVHLNQSSSLPTKTRSLRELISVSLCTLSNVLPMCWFRWICIYPAYINSKKTLKEGRRIPKEKAVDNPTHQEIRDVLVSVGLKVGVENKIYSRERSKEMLYRGRIRVQLRNDDGTPCSTEFPSSELFLNSTILYNNYFFI